MPTKSNIYAVRNTRDGFGTVKTVSMHRLILGLSDPKILGDHADGNGLNNTRGNLRVCTSSQNQMNSRGKRGSSSRFKGVCWNKEMGKWQANIAISKKQKYLGLFENEIDAASEYDKMAIILFGEFAKPNFSK